MAPSPLLRLIHSHRIAWFGLLLLVAAGGVFLVLAKHKTSAMESLVFESLVNGTSQRIEADFDAFFAPVVDNLNIIRRWAEKQSVMLDKPADFNQTFIPILEQFPQISSLILAGSDGNEYFLLNDNGVWLTRTSRPDEWHGRVQWSRWKTPGTLDQQWWEQSDYDPRSRPWFKGAMRLAAAGERFWTSPYTFFTLKQPGITVSTRTSTVDGNSLVVGFDVLLEAIGISTTTAKLGKNGRVFALTHDDRILGPPRNHRFDNDPEALKKAMLTPASALDIAELSAALEAWKSLEEPLGEPFTFTIGKDIWWAVFRSFPRGERGFRIGYVVPQSDFAEDIDMDNSLFLWGGGGLVAFALAAFLLSFLALRRSPWDLAAGIEGEGGDDGPCSTEKVRELLAKGEGENIEFKSTLRWNLNTDKAGKEVEMSWLKTVVAFLNSNGGHLLVGVDDSSQVLGLEADRFANEDKYLLHVNNLINQHIGLERSPYIRFSLVAIDGKKVLVVRCERSRTPVFLSMGKEEEFYIRTGPGSRKLPPSKIVPYLQERE